MEAMRRTSRLVFAEQNPSESRILDWAAMRLIKGADALTAVSNSLKQAIVSKIPDGKGDIQVIHNGVDTDLFVPAENVEERKVILSIGRLVYQKGFDILFHSFYALARSFRIGSCAWQGMANCALPSKTW